MRGEVKRRLAYVNTAHVGGPARGGVHAKGPHVTEAVQHAAAVSKLAHGAAVVLLVKEEARLLAVLKVKREREAVLVHQHVRVQCLGSVPPALVERQALLLARRGIVALVDAAHVLAVGAQHVQQHGVERRAQALHAHGAYLRNQRLLVAVNHQAGKAVGLAEEHAAAVGVGGVPAGAGGASAHGGHAVVPRPRELAMPKRLVNAVVGVACHDAHANLALLREQACTLPRAVFLKHVHHAAVGCRLAAGRGGLEAQNLALKHPRVSRGKRFGRLARNDGLRIGPELLHDRCSSQTNRAPESFFSRKPAVFYKKRAPVLD